MKKLSIITINYNNAQGLKKTIESVIKQSYTNYEYIIIDGNSIDGSVEIIKTYTDYIAYWISEPDNGIYQAMNRGIKKVKGDYCLFLNSGDWLVEGVLEKIISHCEEEDIIYFNTYLSYGIRTEEIRYPEQLTMRNFFRNTIGHQSTLIKSDLFIKYGMYNEKNRIHSDYEFWIKTIINGNCSCKHVNEFLSYYDMNGLSSKPTEKTSKEVRDILESNIPLRILADYENWVELDKQLQVLYWIKSKKSLYYIVVLIYKIASYLVTSRKKSNA